MAQRERWSNELKSLQLALSLIWFLLKREEIGYMADSVDYVSSTLAQLDAIFSYLESYPYKRHQHLKQLCEPFYLHPDKRPSVLLRQLSGLARQVSLQRSAEYHNASTRGARHKGLSK